ncbi:hypothetical protein LACPH_001781 [Lacticaseibacillus parahuelsenbergensis]|uniref:Uncharacterized protein n=1 Tax=Lacticaseibacillus parahuelsenbergensis TaxID=3068305 RepID=A0ABY9KZW5_9LACO|nr:hypothetical protein [Lacticaseibacillus sp. NCIMB 15471]WLV77062.1 hypothetical protein LACPH_001781 [Lacticaseibacillus sp. NCIMB 15471]
MRDKRRWIYMLLPFATAIAFLVGAVVLKNMYGFDYSNLLGFKAVLGSVVGFVSIVIGFYSAFYGMIISMSRSTFFLSLKHSRFKKDLPRILLYSLLSAFMTLILTIALQILVNYKSILGETVYFVWVFMTGVFMTYALQTSILSIAIVFFGNSDQIEVKKI